jgi:hypothetical protein
MGHEDRLSARALRRGRSTAAAFLLAVCAAGTSCGGGGSGGGEPAGPSPPPAPLALVVVDTARPVLAPSVPVVLPLEAVGGTPPLRWSLVPGTGSPPPGLFLDAAGSLVGTPGTAGTFAFTVRVEDSSAPADTASGVVSLVVGGFDLVVVGLTCGEPWTGTSYVLASPVGGTTVTFTLARNGSGGRILDEDPAAHSARYEAGPMPGLDVVRARREDGTFAEVALSVVENPVPFLTARFGSTDVWWVRLDGLRDPSHGFASDFDAAMAAVGLRAPSSRGAKGTAADEYARFFVRRETLSRLSMLYGNEADGRPRADGLDISFPFERPSLAHAVPGDGTATAPFPGGYNVFGVQAGALPPLLGFALLDTRDNDALESLVATDANPLLGAFVDEVARQFNEGYANVVLPAAPIGDADVPALRALAYGLPFEDAGAPMDARSEELRRIGQGFARSLAHVIAHEIGHALGLLHPVALGSLMNPPFGTITSPGAELAFSPGERSLLSEALPGPGR